MITISLCMIVKNEESLLERCLDSVQHVVDEINIIDTGSTDRTKDIAQHYTSRIFDFPWCDDFAKARNFSFQQATKDYILWLDADDVLTSEHQQKLVQLKQFLYPSIDAVSMDYVVTLEADGTVATSEKKYRLVKRARHYQWRGAVHEFLDVTGNIYKSDVAVVHVPVKQQTARNLRIYERLIADGYTFAPRDFFHYANELKQHSRFLEAINHYHTFLDTALETSEAQVQACLNLADCYEQLQDTKNATQAVFQSLLYDQPKPETCCRIGQHFMAQSKNKEAIYWYSQALQVTPCTIGVYKRAYSTWIPHYQLSLLYDRLRLYENAYEHNEAARHHKPNDQRILDHQQYLRKQLHK
ncbi:glycosyltransferase family 2 protein [Lysinibacillus tabacifolii]|uniref:Glycosyltransferase family 2 protein n=1 Tax=Lysinibacillus tabacifolii TaxID=1173107 RepID=A0ABY2T225_9BACI|nr:glycosyltransferase family 2 protein [Lysinibacillus tabacifolii]TKI48929.1 glycosyltransferase family 2 protein [Lysinibacillus tabacifolii]